MILNWTNLDPIFNILPQPHRSFIVQMFADFFYITAKYVEHFKPHPKGLLIPAVGQVVNFALNWSNIFQTVSRSQSTLIIAEHNNEKLNAATLHAVTAAGQLGGEVAGSDSFWPFFVTLLSTGELPGGRDWLCCCGQGGCLGCWCLQGRSMWQPWNLLKEANPQVLLADSPAYTGFLPEHLTPLLVSAQNQFKYTHIVAVSRSRIYMYDYAYFFSTCHTI